MLINNNISNTPNTKPTFKAQFVDKTGSVYTDAVQEYLRRENYKNPEKKRSLALLLQGFIRNAPGENVEITTDSYCNKFYFKNTTTGKIIERDIKGFNFWELVYDLLNYRDFWDDPTPGFKSYRKQKSQKEYENPKYSYSKEKSSERKNSDYWSRQNKSDKESGSYWSWRNSSNTKYSDCFTRKRTTQNQSYSPEKTIIRLAPRLNSLNHVTQRDFLYTFSKTDIKDLAQLFGTTEDKVINMDKKTYRQLCIKWHPDKNQDPFADKVFKLLVKFAA